MTSHVDPDTLHRTAKYFMDTGRAQTSEAALGILQGYGLSIRVEPSTAATRNGQIALLTLVNMARRTFLGGVEIEGLPDIPCVISLTNADRLQAAVEELGGRCVARVDERWPLAAIGNVEAGAGAAWHLNWTGWRGGVVPARMSPAINDPDALPLAPCLAAALCAAEAFAVLACDHPLAGRRAVGLSLWNVMHDWLTDDPTEPLVTYLPSRLWLIGLGNLGQAYSWLLACLPFRHPADVSIVLQDFDRVQPSNDSTSMLSSLAVVSQRKARHVASWLDKRGFDTAVIEQRFSETTRPFGDDPKVALCGVDNALARSMIEDTGFELVVEAGLGAGPSGFRSFSMHCFPSDITARRLWANSPTASGPDVSAMPAYEALKGSGANACGLAQLASRTIGVPFVGLTAGIMVISELVRRLHGGHAYQVVSGSLLGLSGLEAVRLSASPYAFGHVTI